MATYTTNWEDDDCSRIVQLSVDYQLVDDRIEIKQVTPQSIRFLNTQGPTDRTIRIWTDKGRQILRHQHTLAVGTEPIRAQIESQLAVPTP